MIELYYSRYSINSEKVLLCLFEKDIAFTGHHIDLFKFEQTTPVYLKLNPLGLVPTLVVDGVPIVELTVINEFIEDLSPERPLHPADAVARAQVRIWVQHFQEFFYPAMAVLSQIHLFADELKRRWIPDELERLIRLKPIADRAARQLRAIREGLGAEEIAAAERNAGSMLDRMEAQLARGAEWLAGSFSLADLAAAPNVHRFALLGLERFLEQRPGISGWYRRIRERPAFKRTYAFAPSVFDSSPTERSCG